MPTNSVRALVDAEWLAGNLNSPHVAVVDGSWHLPTINRDPLAEFETTHIPGAVFFDIDRIADDANLLVLQIIHAAGEIQYPELIEGVIEGIDGEVTS